MSTMKVFHTMLQVSNDTCNHYLESLKMLLEVDASKVATLSTEINWDAWPTDS